MEEKVSRIGWIDWAKAVCITLMVIGHTYIPEDMRRVIYSFHMPAFLILCGYLYKPGSLKKLFYSIGVPVLTVYVINLFLHILIKDATIHQLLFTPGALFPYRYPHWGAFFVGMWFIHVLVVCRIVLGDVPCLSVQKHYKAVAVLCLILTCIFQIIGVQSDLFIFRFFPCFPFVAFGIYLKECHWQARIQNRWVVLALALVYVLLTFTNDICDIYFMKFGYSYSMFFIGAVAGCLLMFHFCSYLKNNNLIRLTSIGTLIIMGVHKTMFPFFMNHVIGKLYDLSWLITSVEMMIVCLGIVWILQLCLPQLLGKRNN